MIPIGAQRACPRRPDDDRGPGQPLIYISNPAVAALIEKAARTVKVP
jgi:hypothetical protein